MSVHKGTMACNIIVPQVPYPIYTPMTPALGQYILASMDENPKSDSEETNSCSSQNTIFLQSHWPNSCNPCIPSTRIPGLSMNPLVDAPVLIGSTITSIDIFSVLDLRDKYICRALWLFRRIWSGAFGSRGWDNATVLDAWQGSCDVWGMLSFLDTFRITRWSWIPWRLEARCMNQLWGWRLCDVGHAPPSDYTRDVSRWEEWYLEARPYQKPWSFDFRITSVRWWSLVGNWYSNFYSLVTK